MPTLKESLWPIVAIIVASAIVMFAIAPLDSSEWADSMRGEFSAEAEGRDGEPFAEGEGGPSGILRFIGPLIKITILMGVPGLITMGILRITRRFGQRSPAGATPS